MIPSSSSHHQHTAPEGIMHRLAYTLFLYSVIFFVLFTTRLLLG